MIEALRRNMMSAIIEEESPYKELYGELYPKSTYSEKGDELFLLQELEETFSTYDYGVKFPDSNDDITIKYSSGNLKGGYAYVKGGIITRKFSLGSEGTTITLPADATCRMYFGPWSFYPTTSNIIKECLAIKKGTGVSTVFYTGNIYNYNCLQVYIKKDVSEIFYDNIRNQGSADAVEIDTCTLNLHNSGNNRIVQWNNFPQLESVIIRKAAGNVLYTGSYATFKGCTNIKKVKVEWDTSEEIPIYNTKMELPMTATLYIPQGTRQMYLDKGWNFAEIIEY